jgi:3-mercaptopyruvate sulfurtransferase SseA
MKLLKQYWLILLILLPVTVLVLIRSLNSNSFRYDAVKWASPSADGSNLLTPDQVAGAGEGALLILLGDEAEAPARFAGQTVVISPADISGKENLKMIRKNEGPVILTSDDGSVAARVWMVLSEMGTENVYIVSDSDSDAG